ncbi:MAG TPA: endonuclease/exonuclease/phosphatase family protein [Candidatus Methylomirabilis sp.]|nr:endonuclease/exonuclease/phosphatase family protein [Candidatus Methylomirabilis sp.]
MIRVLAMVAASVCLCVLPAARAGSVSMTEPVRPLKVVTLNLYHGGPFSGLLGDAQHLDRRLEMVARELRMLDPDIIGLQEASESRQRGNVAARLAAQLGLQYVFAAANPRPFKSSRVNRLIASLLNFSEGPAIVTRFPIAAWESLDLPRCGRYADSRLLLHARLLSPWGGLDVFSTHTIGDRCQTGRVAQLVRNRRGPFPSVLMGDFNAGEDSPAIAAITQIGGLVDAFRTVNPSVPGLTVWQRIDAPTSMVKRRGDYLFVCPGTEYPGKVLSSRVVLNTPQHLPDGSVLWPSDHYGVLARLEVFPPNRHADGE